MERGTNGVHGVGKGLHLLHILAGGLVPLLQSLYLHT
jgi:hypothetical protein